MGNNRKRLIKILMDMVRRPLNFAKWLFQTDCGDGLPDYYISPKQFENNKWTIGEGVGISIGRADKTDRSLAKNRIRQSIQIPDKARTGHCLCIGTTGVGKTRIIENMVEEDIRKGYNILIIDPKIDHDLFEKVVQVASEERRLDDLILINPIFPDYSATIDPLARHYMIEELVAHVVSGVSDGKEPYFKDVARSVSLAIIEAFDLLAKYEKVPLSLNLQTIKNNVSITAIESLKAQVESIDDNNLANEARQISLDLSRILDNPRDYFNKVSNGLAVALQELTSGNVGKIVGQTHGNRFLERLEAGKRVIMVVQLGSLLANRAGFTLGKVILSMVQTFVGRRFAARNPINPPMMVVADEFQNMLYRGIDDLFAKARGAGVSIHGFCQSISQIHAALGKDYGNTIMDNTNTKLFMRVPDPETADYASKYFGKRFRMSPFFTVASGRGISGREIEEDVITASHILNLKQRDFFLHSYAGAFKGKTMDTSPAWMSVQFPTIEG